MDEHGDRVEAGGAIVVPAAGRGPHGQAQGEEIAQRAVERRRRIELDVFAVHDAGIAGAFVHAGGHGQNLPQLDIGFAGIGEREGFGQVSVGEDPGFQPFGEPVLVLVEHDAGGHAGVGFGHGSHVRSGVPVPSAPIFLIHQPAVARHQQAAMLAGSLRIVQRPVEPFHVDAGDAQDAGGIFASVRQPPAVSGGGKYSAPAFCAWDCSGQQAPAKPDCNQRSSFVFAHSFRRSIREPAGGAISRPNLPNRRRRFPCSSPVGGWDPAGNTSLRRTISSARTSCATGMKEPRLAAVRRRSPSVIEA